MKGIVFAAVLAAASLQASNVVAESLLERGTYLMRGIVACGNCHTPMGPNGPIGDKELSGGMLIHEPGVFDVHGPNITSDRETGIGAWTNEQIVTAIREGKRPDGSVIGPPMPFEQYRHMSDRDVQAIVAYLRSVPAVRSTTPKNVYHVPLPPAWGPPVGSVPEPDRGDKVAYGAYLAGPLGHCIECHTPMEKGRFDFANRAFAGGFRFHGPWGISVSPNITQHAEDGIGAFTDAQIEAAITRGIHPDGRALMPPMPFDWYANITDGDLGALVAFLRTVKPLPGN